MTDKKKQGLGRGLSALFGDQNVPEENSDNLTSQKLVLISDLERNRYQPRLTFDEEKLKNLSDSIKKNGVIQPIAVRPDENNSGKYEIVAGERRWIAAQRAGLHRVPIVVLNLNDSETLEVAIVENIQREDLNIIEEAKGYLRLSEEFNYDQGHIAKLMSKSRSYISNTMRLLNLPKDVISMIEEGSLTAGQARPLIGIANASEIAEEVVRKKLSARVIEDITRKKRNQSSKDAFRDSNIEDEQRKLEGILGLKVNINHKKNNSGKVSIEYKNLGQFELISELLKRN